MKVYVVHLKYRDLILGHIEGYPCKIDIDQNKMASSVTTSKWATQLVHGQHTNYSLVTDS